MLKKAGVVAAAAAGLLMLGAPAFAGEVGGDGDGNDINSANNGQVGLVNLNDIDIIKDINVNAVAGVCNNDVAVLGVVVPILSPDITGNCAAGGIVD